MKTTITTIILGIITFHIGFSQIQAPQNFFLGLEPLEEIMMDEMDPEAEIDLTGVEHKVIAYFTVADTMNISSIYIKLGTTVGGSDLLDSSFVFDSTELAEPQRYIRTGKNIRITLGSYAWLPLFYAELKLEDHNGQFSESVSYTAE